MVETDPTIGLSVLLCVWTPWCLGMTDLGKSTGELAALNQQRQGGQLS